MRATLRIAADQLAAYKALRKAVEHNDAERIHAALITLASIDSIHYKGRKQYSPAFRHAVVGDCQRYGVKRASILNGIPFDTCNHWYKKEKREQGHAYRNGRTLGGSAGYAPKRLHSIARKSPKRRRQMPKQRARDKIAAKLAAMTSTDGG